MDDRRQQRSGDDSHRAYLNGEGMSMETELRPEVAAHLAEEAASPEELHELRATAALLGALPQVAPRRTFILTPELVAAAGGPRARQRRLGWVWPTRWATAIAAVCFAVTIGLGQGGAAEPTAVVPSSTAPVATAVTTPTTEPDIRTPLVGVFGLTPSYILPTATAVPMPLPPTPPAAPVVRTDWRPAQIALGALTGIGVFFGFLLPPFLRRRGMATA
jgi:hypothetical protein